MSNFSVALTECLSEKGWEQTKFAEDVGLSRGQINRYARGMKGDRKALPKPSTLVSICTPFNSDQQARLVVAYLRDQQAEIPAEMANSAIILPTSTRIREVNDSLPDLDPDLRRAVIFLSKLAVDHTEIRDLILHWETVLASRVKKSVS